MNFFSIVENSFRSYKKNLLLLVIPHLIEYVMDFLFSVVLGVIVIMIFGISSLSRFSPGFKPELPFGSIMTLFFCILLISLVFILVNAGKRASIIYMSKEIYKTEKTSLSSGFEGVKKYLIRIFTYILMIGVFFTVSILLPLFFIYMGNKFYAIFSFIFMFGIFSLFSFFSMFTPQKIVVEDCSTIEGIKKSFRFVVGNISGVIFYGLLVFMFYFGLAILYISFIRAPDYVIAFLNLLFVIASILAPPYFEVLKTYMVLEDIDVSR